MAAVAAEPRAAGPTTTRTQNPEGPEPGPAQPGPAGPELPADTQDMSGPRGVEQVHREDRERAGGGAARAGSAGGSGAGSGGSGSGGGEDGELQNLSDQPGTGTGLLLSQSPVDLMGDRLGDRYRSSLLDPQSSAVFLHSYPAPPPGTGTGTGTEAGLSLAEPAEPTDRDRDYPELRPGPGPAEDLLDPETEPGFRTSAGTEDSSGPGPGRAQKRRLLTEPLKQEDSSGPGPESGTGPGPVQVLSPGSEVRVSLDHVIDDALVVSFRLGEKMFSGVLMDVSKRFGPYGIPITVFPRRDDRSRPQMAPSPPATDVDPTAKQEEITASPVSAPPPHPHPWTAKPPPLFQEGALYPPPLFIRDTYNQALPQPLPRKIKRPKRRYRCEEPTSIMNAIKLRPRQVLCDKCKGVVASGGHREARRCPVDLRGEEVSRRRRAAEGPISSEVKRLRSDDKGGRTAADRRSSSGIRVSSSPSPSSRRVLRGVASSSSSPSSVSSRMCLKLNPKKVLAKGPAVDCSKAPQVLKKLARSSQPPSPSPPPPHRRPKDQNQNQNQGQTQNQDGTKAVTRAAALQNHNQKVHFTRRLQHLSGAAVSSSSLTPLPPRMRLKPQSTTLKSC